jgi:phosphohistidine phosphatase SixA
MKYSRLWAAAWLFALASAPASALELVYVVRHAQKTDPWTLDDRLRPLSEKGAACAAGLAEKLAGEGIGAVYSTETVRTLATGAAVSGADPRIKVYGDDSVSHDSDWVRRILRTHRGDRAILIVGHSNTVEVLVRAFRPDTKDCLAELRLAEIPDGQYGDVWRLEIGETEGCKGVTRESQGQVGGVDCTTP